MKECTLYALTLVSAPCAFIVGAMLYRLLHKLLYYVSELKFKVDYGYALVPVAASIAMVWFMTDVIPKHITVTKCDSHVKSGAKYVNQSHIKSPGLYLCSK